MVLDRHGQLLRPYLTPAGRWRLPVTPAEVDPRFLDMLVAVEDRRFFSHHGVDPLALGRAALQLVQHGRIVSGGSTLTMQVARLLEPRSERSLAAKLRQMVRAVQLEQRFSKPEILTLYLRACALWRQPRRHPRRGAQLFRPRAEAIVVRRVRAAGRTAAIARDPAARPRA